MKDFTRIQNKGSLVLIALLCIVSQAFSQNSVTTYYDEEWMVCEDFEATYYRVYQVDHTYEPTGEIRDYFITGELQCIIDEAIYIDPEDDAQSLWRGESNGYTRDGRQEFSIVYSQQGELLSRCYYYYRNNGEFDYLLYELTGENSYIKCNRDGVCERIFRDEFDDENNPKGWESTQATNDKSGIGLGPEFGGLAFFTDKESILAFNEFSFELSRNFSISASIIVDDVSRSSAATNTIYWAWSDWDNYNYLSLHSDGYIKAGWKFKGMNVDHFDWYQSADINTQMGSVNTVNVVRLENDLFFSVNGEIIYIEEDMQPQGGDIIALQSGSEGYSASRFVEFSIINEIPTPEFEDTQENQTDSWAGNGSGFFISTDGLIATNYHVIEDAVDIEVEFIRDGLKMNYPAEVVKSDQQNDLSIIRIKDDRFEPFSQLPYNFTSQLAPVGTSVFALGYPLALSIMGDEIKFTDGKINSKTGLNGDITTYQISVPIQPGNSGGPLFDYDGNLVGITSSGISRELDLTENVNYAIKSNYLNNLTQVLDQSVQLPSNTSLAPKPLTEKIATLSDYVVLVKIR